MKWHYWSPIKNIKLYLRYENKVNESEVLSYCDTSRCKTRISYMSNIDPLLGYDWCMKYENCRHWHWGVAGGSSIFPPWNIKSQRGKLTFWGRVTHICVSKLTIISSDNGFSPDRCLAIIWTYARMLIGAFGTNFSEILIEFLTFSYKKMRLKMSSAKRWPFCIGLNVLKFSPQ